MKIDRRYSAGGVVIHNGKVLTIYSPIRGTLGLPKGTIDDGESQEETAVRETLEETGYRAKIIEKLHDYTYEFTSFDGQRILKTVSYFLMRLTHEEPLQANLQPGEDFEVRWLTAEEALDSLSYADSKDAVALALKHNILDF